MNGRFCGTTKVYAILALAVVGSLCGCNPSNSKDTQAPPQAHPRELAVVSEGSTHAVIVPGQDNPDISMQAAQELQKNLLLSTSVKIPINVDGVDALAPDDTAIIVGAGEAARARGVDAAALKSEAYRIKITPRYMVLVGHDIPTPGEPDRTVAISRATQWAVDYLLDRYVGVRWLWPGQLGTYAPRHENISFPVMDITRRPALDMRQMPSLIRGDPDFPSTFEIDPTQLQQEQAELDLWKSRHELGIRTSVRFGASFTDWWADYRLIYPNYFALPPSEAQCTQPCPEPDRVKLRLGNPAVTDQIIANWQAAGKPDAWDVSPNDGKGFDTSAASRAMDYPPDQSKQNIWRGRADLAIRYVKFWNGLLKRMKRENPQVRLSSYAYSAYRKLPKPATLESGMNIAVIGGYNQKAREQWSEWSEAGARLYLRPNWWWVGEPAPYIPLDTVENFFKFATTHGMQGFRFAGLNGYWGSQGPYYYLIARLSERPDLSVEQIIAEYASAFGDAAPAIEDYLHFWEDYSDKVAYDVPSGGPVVQDPNGLYAQYLESRGIHRIDPRMGSWMSIPSLYSDAMLQEANDILDRARALAGRDSDTVRERIAFLRSGLRYLHVVRNLLSGKPFNEGVGGEAAQAESLQDYIEYLSKKGVIWGMVASKQINRFVESP